MQNVLFSRLHAEMILVVLVPALGCATGCAPAIDGAGARSEQVVHVTAKRFEYLPAEVHVKRGVPVVLELTSLDHVHGFAAPDFDLRSDVPPGQITRVRFVPEHTGRFDFHCDVFCGSGHDDMAGEIVVDE